MVAIRTRKATPAPTATPMMTAMGTDSVGEKQTQLTRGPTTHSSPGPHPVPLGAAPAKLGPDHCTRALLGSACGGVGGRHRQNPAGSAQVEHGVGERVGAPGEDTRKGGGRGRQADMGRKGQGADTGDERQGWAQFSSLGH